MEKIYVLTGGTAGIGKAIAEKILSEEDKNSNRIIVNYGHDDRKAEAFLNEVPDKKRKRILLIKADLSNYDCMVQFVHQVKEKCEKVDYLVCNTGIGSYKKYKDYTYDDWQHIMNTNLSIPVFMIREFMPILNKNASILLMGSYAGQQAYSSSLAYGVSKAGLLFLAKALVKELEPIEARVNAIAPGFIETAWQKERTEESYKRVNRKIALHRFGFPNEVADMAYAVLINSYMNGAIIDIHGGYDYF